MTTTKLNLMTDEQLIIYAQQACQPLTGLSGTSDEAAIAELMISLLIEMEETERPLSANALLTFTDAMDPDDDDEEVVDDDDDDDMDGDDDDDDFGDDDEDDMDDDDDDAEPIEEAEEEDDM